MSAEKVIGVDLGATHIRAAVVSEGQLSPITAHRIRSQGTEQEVLEDVYQAVDACMHSDITAIGIGVPSVVDVATGVVYDVQYIPAWKEVPLKQWMEQRYGIPVFVNNDANCFALGEHYFGKGKNVRDMIGLTLGTGVGAGIIINHKLYAGANCGAGEFGMVNYLDEIYEYYCSGSFFKNIYGEEGESVYEKARSGNAEALDRYAMLGTHLGNAIKMIMYTYDPPLIILGGSVRKAYPFFEHTMWQRIQTFAFKKSAERIQIEVSALQNSALLGAAALYYDAAV